MTLSNTDIRYKTASKRDSVLSRLRGGQGRPPHDIIAEIIRCTSFIVFHLSQKCFTAPWQREWQKSPARSPIVDDLQQNLIPISQPVNVPWTDGVLEGSDLV